MASMAVETGFDGIDLTVRPGGHVLPERVEQDLPAAVETIRSAGLEVPMITTMIADPSSPHAEPILRTAGALGIPYYRWGYLRYAPDKAVSGQLAGLKTQVRALAELSRECGVCGMYHVHSGVWRVGASIWDLWLLLRECDPRWIGVNYDIGHAVVEGGLGGWIHSANLVTSHLKGVAVKDFTWGRGATGRWEPRWCAPGEGMVDFAAFFTMLRQARFAGPFQLHYEYPGLGGAEEGEKVLKIERRAFLAVLKKDLKFMKEQLRRAELS